MPRKKPNSSHFISGSCGGVDGKDGNHGCVTETTQSAVEGRTDCDSGRGIAGNRQWARSAAARLARNAFAIEIVGARHSIGIVFVRSNTRRTAAAADIVRRNAYCRR